MKQFFITIIFLLISIFSISQKESDKVNFEITRDVPEFNFLGATAYIVSLQADRYCSPVSVGGNLFGSYGRMYAQVKYLLGVSLTDYMSYNDITIHSIYKDNYSTSFEATFGVGISSSQHKKDVKVLLKTENKVSYVIYVPANVLTSFNIEGAYSSGMTTFIGDAKSFKGKPIGTDQVLAFNTNEKLLSTYYQYGVVNIGASITKKYNVYIKTDQYGEKRGNSFARFYARLSYLMSSNIDDVAVKAVPGYYYQYQLNNVTPMKKIGFNVGAYVGVPNKFGASGFAELGVLPGPQSRALGRVYLNIGGGFSLSKIFD